MKLSLLVFLLLTLHISAFAQPCAGPGMTAQTAQAVCGTLTFTESVLPNCDGPYIPNGSSGCGSVNSSRSRWYKFHCYQAGTLGFLITPIVNATDYDWELMDVTGRPASDIYTTELRVSLNLSGVNGPTGCTPAGTSDVRCAGGANGTQYNRMPTLIAGHDYLLMVMNYDATGIGYSINFSGTAVLVDPGTVPEATNVSLTNCEANQIRVTFNKDISCATVTSSGSEFTITNGTNVITGITSSCSQLGGTSITELLINLSAPLSPGTHNVVIASGSDGDTFTDICNNPLAPATLSLTVPPQTVQSITGIAFSGCAPKVLEVNFAKPIRCSSISPTGSEFSMTPGSPAIVSAQGVCTGAPAWTKVVRLTLQDPLPFGSYQLLINNGSDGNTFIDTCGVAMLTGSTASVTIPQPVAPVIQSITYDECKPYLVKINFDKPIRCASLSTNEFTVTPGGLSVNSVTTECASNGGAYTKSVTLNLSGNLSSGNFNVSISNGTDGNTLSDTCFAFMPANTTRAFVATRAPAPVFDSLQYDKCTPSQVKIFYNKPIACDLIQKNGSQFFVTGPVPVTITSVTSAENTCGATPSGSTLPYSHTLIVNFSAPVNTSGTFLLHNRIAGGQRITDTCYGLQNVNETIAFNVLGKPSAEFTDAIKWGCEKDTLVFSHPGGPGINSWRWTFSDGTTDVGQNVTHIFPASTVTATAQLIVNNGQCSDTLQRSYTLDNAFKPVFVTQPQDTICRTTPLNFTNNSTGKNLQYLWQLGDNTTFAGVTPPPHLYSNSKDYTIRLIATNDHNCKDTATASIFVTATPTVSFATVASQYCSGDVVSLSATMTGNISSYTWNNGDGKTFSNTANVNFSYPSEKIYTITLTANDRFCDAAVATASTQVYAIPVVNLGDDKILCPGIKRPIGIAAINGYSYLWNTGATTPVIITELASKNYVLTADNHGCKNSDDVAVQMLDNCLIRVAGAFTPNNDGRNDLLKAINAELATNFILKVYNRNGQMIFSTTDPTKGWDGRQNGQPADAGTYVWQLSYIDPISHKQIFDKGTTVLIR